MNINAGQLDCLVRPVREGGHSKWLCTWVSHLLPRMPLKLSLIDIIMSHADNELICKYVKL